MKEILKYFELYSDKKLEKARNTADSSLILKEGSQERLEKNCASEWRDPHFRVTF